MVLSVLDGFSVNSCMGEDNRKERTKQILFDIMKQRGVVYTLGLCIGILSRLTRYDIQLYQELKTRHKQLTDKQ